MAINNISYSKITNISAQLPKALIPVNQGLNSVQHIEFYDYTLRVYPRRKLSYKDQDKRITYRFCPKPSISSRC